MGTTRVGAWWACLFGMAGLLGCEPEPSKTDDDADTAVAGVLSSSTTPPTEKTGAWSAPQKLIRRASGAPAYGTITWTFGSALCRDAYHNVHMLYYNTQEKVLYYRNKAPGGTALFRPASAMPKGATGSVKFGSIACTEEIEAGTSGSIVGLTAAWVEQSGGQNFVYLSRSTDLGTTWSTPPTLVYDPGAGGDIDHLTLLAYGDGSKTHVVIGFLEDSDVEDHFEYKVARRHGTSWSASSFAVAGPLNAPFTHVDTGGTKEHEASSANTPNLGSTGDGTVYAVWDTKNDTVGDKRVYTATSLDHGATWGEQKQVVVDGTATDCNDPTASVTSDGNLYIVCQDVNHLDLYRSEDGAATFTLVTDDLTDDVNTPSTGDTPYTERGMFGAIAISGADMAIAWEGYCGPNDTDGCDVNQVGDIGKYVGLAFAQDIVDMPSFETPNFMHPGNQFDDSQVYSDRSPMGDAALQTYYLDVVWVTNDDTDAPTTGEVYHRQYRIR